MRVSKEQFISYFRTVQARLRRLRDILQDYEVVGYFLGGLIVAEILVQMYGIFFDLSNTSELVVAGGLIQGFGVLTVAIGLNRVRVNVFGRSGLWEILGKGLKRWKYVFVKPPSVKGVGTVRLMPSSLSSKSAISSPTITDGTLKQRVEALEK